MSTIETRNIQEYLESLPQDKLQYIFDIYQQYIEIIKDCNGDVVDLSDIYTPEALEEFSLKNLFFRDRAAREHYLHLFQEYNQLKTTRAKNLDLMLHGTSPSESYYQTFLNNKAIENNIRTTQEALSFFKDVNKSIEVYILGSITNVIRPYIYNCIKMLNVEMNSYGKFIISGGEAFNFNVKKEYRAVTPDIDTKFVPFYQNIKNNRHSDKIMISVNDKSVYTNFLHSIHDMWYIAMEKVLNYLNSRYKKMYSDVLLALENTPEFKMLNVVFIKPAYGVSIFRKRMGIFDKKISGEGGVFYNLPLFTFDMDLASYYRTEKDIEIPYKKPEEEDDDDVDYKESSQDDLVDDNDIVYSRSLSIGQSILGVLDCPFMKPNENGYDIGFKDGHVQIVSTNNSCSFKLLYASTEYISEDINKLIELKLRAGKSEKDVYRQQVIADPRSVVNLLCGDNVTLGECDSGVRETEVSNCRWDNIKSCNFSPMSIGKIISYCAPPKWIITDTEEIYQEKGIVDRNYIDKKCCQKWIITEDEEARSRIYRCATTSYYDYERNNWISEPPINLVNFDKVDLYLDTDITYRFDKSFFNRYGVSKELALIIKYDTDNIINHMISYLTRVKQTYDRSVKLEADKVTLKNAIGRMCLFYNPYLIEHENMNLKMVSNLVRIFTTGLIYNNRYADSGILIDKILTYIGDEMTIFTDPPPKSLEPPSIEQTLSRLRTSIEQIKETAYSIDVARYANPIVPRDLYKIFIVDNKENLRKLEYIESFYPDDIKEQDKDALRLYVTSSMKLNKKLRNRATVYNHYEKLLYISLLNIIKNSQRNDIPITVYRGLTGESVDSTYLRQLYETGRVSDQFTSVSISPAVAYNFVRGSACCVLRLYVIDTQMIYLEPLKVQKFEYEYELLLPPGIVFYYLGEQEQVVNLGDVEIGKVNVIDCLVTQLQDPQFDQYIRNFIASHNLQLTQNQIKTKQPLRMLKNIKV